MSDSDGQAELWFVPGRSGQGNVYRGNAGLGMLGSAKMQTVSVGIDVVSSATLRQSLPGPLDLVKVDVEGLERVVIRELTCLRWRYLLVELGGVRDGALGSEEVLRLLTDAGVHARVVRSFGNPTETHDVLLKRLNEGVRDGSKD